MPNPRTGYTSAEGSHTHSAALSMDRVSDHGHEVKVTIPSGGSHTHPLKNASAANGGSHTHSLNLNIDSKRHNHILSGSTGISGNDNTHNNMPPYMAVNYYIYTGRSLL
ncbi:MAG: hypothetical protein II870_09540 [Synergistaceae bacterium]|nr:hypothetical protein [Synergistaceae bacterium]